MKKRTKKQQPEPNFLSKWLPTLIRIAWDILTNFEKIKHFLESAI